MLSVDHYISMPINLHVLSLQLCMSQYYKLVVNFVIRTEKVEGHSACFGFVSMLDHSGEYFYFPYELDSYSGIGTSQRM